MNITERLLSGTHICAHRGYRASFPENTMPAFEACEGLCQLIEMDVRFSADGIAMIFHDNQLQRTSNIKKLAPLSGRQQHTFETFNSDELKTLDASSWYIESDPFDQISSGKVIPESIQSLQTPIPTLQEFLQFMQCSSMDLNLEIKQLGKDPLASLLNIFSLLDRYAMSDRCVISAFNHDILRHIKRLRPEQSTAALVDKHHPKNMLKYLADLQVEGYHVNDQLADSQLVQQIQDAGLFLGVYTVNDSQRKKQLLDMGVNSVITDFLE